MNVPELERFLRHRYSNVEVLHVDIEGTDKGVFQRIRYRGTRKQLLASGLASGRMFDIQPAHWKTCVTTELGCFYSLFCLDPSEDVWELYVASGPEPRDTYRATSFLTKEGLKETNVLLKHVFSSARTQS